MELPHVATLDIATVGAIPRGIPLPSFPGHRLARPRHAAAAVARVLPDRVQRGHRRRARCSRCATTTRSIPTASCWASRARTSRSRSATASRRAAACRSRCVNDEARARTPVAIVVCSAWMAVVLLFLTGLFERLPQPLLAALVLASVGGMFRIDELRQLRRVSTPRVRHRDGHDPRRARRGHPEGRARRVHLLAGDADPPPGAARVRAARPHPRHRPLRVARPAPERAGACPASSCSGRTPRSSTSTPTPSASTCCRCSSARRCRRAGSSSTCPSRRTSTCRPCACCSTSRAARGRRASPCSSRTRTTACARILAREKAAHAAGRPHAVVLDRRARRRTGIRRAGAPAGSTLRGASTVRPPSRRRGAAVSVDAAAARDQRSRDVRAARCARNVNGVEMATTRVRHRRDRRRLRRPGRRRRRQPLGAKVALVEKHRLGGDCLWYGCVPSKSLIKSARVAHEMRHADRWALHPADAARRPRAR